MTCFCPKVMTHRPDIQKYLPWTATRKVLLDVGTMGHGPHGWRHVGKICPKNFPMMGVNRQFQAKTPKSTHRNISPELLFRRTSDLRTKFRPWNAVRPRLSLRSHRRSSALSSLSDSAAESESESWLFLPVIVASTKTPLKYDCSFPLVLSRTCLDFWFTCVVIVVIVVSWSN